MSKWAPATLLIARRGHGAIQIWGALQGYWLVFHMLTYELITGSRDPRLSKS